MAAIFTAVTSVVVVVVVATVFTHNFDSIHAPCSLFDGRSGESLGDNEGATRVAHHHDRVGVLLDPKGAVVGACSV